MRRAWMFAGLGLVFACSGSSEPTRSSATAARASSASTASATAKPSASPVARPSSTTSSGASPVTLAPLPDAPTHFGVASPPAANPTCKPLPATKNAYSPVAKAARRLACEPALFLLAGSELRKELALPDDHKVELVGASTVTLRFPKGKSAELAAAMGATGAIAKRRNAGAWGWRIWDLVTDTKTGAFELWGPGKIHIGVGVDEAGKDDKVETLGLEHATLDGYLAVTMPEDVLPRVDDTVASQHLLAGLNKIADDKKNLAAEPAEIAELAGLASERFRLSRRAIGTGPDAIKGIDVWTARTQIAAGPVIEALELSGTIEHDHAHDSDGYLLYLSGKSEFGWRGLKVELSFEKREGAAADGKYGEWLLSGITLMP